MNRIVYFLVIFLSLNFLVPSLHAETKGKVLGKIWTLGFFEVSAGIAGNSKFTYVADTNNAQIQVFDENQKPVFHFGGYGTKKGQFVSIQGIQSTNNEVYISSINDYQKKIGKIQVFSDTGIYSRTFKAPKLRSDFIRTSPLLNGNIYAITEKTLCVFRNLGNIVNEFSELNGTPFIDLKDIAATDSHILIIDSQRRGFTMANPDLSKSETFGEEFISIPVAIESSSDRIFVADTKGNLSIFSLSGKYISSIQIDSDVLINGLLYIEENALLATTSKPHSILKISISTSEVSTLDILPSKNIELHWPAKFCLNSRGTLFTNDDHNKGIKCINSNTNEFISHIGLIEQEPEKVFINPLDLTCSENNKLYVIDQNATKKIYCIEDNTINVFFEGLNSRFTQLQTYKQEIIALDWYNQALLFISKNGDLNHSLKLPVSKNHFIGFAFFENDLYIVDQSGLVTVLDSISEKEIRSFNLDHFDKSSSTQLFFIPHLDRIVLSDRDNCCINIYNNKNGKLFSTFGHIGGPNTYVQDSNSQIDLWFEIGSFLFPEKIQKHNNSLFIADSGNQRIQSIPFKNFLITVITLQIGNSTAYVNGEIHSLDAEPFINEGRTMVPLRFISESFKAKVLWNNTIQEITILDNGVKIILKIGSRDMFVNQKKILLDSPPLIQKNRTFVPIRAISEALHAVIEWDAVEQIVTVRRL
ncbi:MAG: hypothetical protein KAH01_02920 [Caldisericia bacterium]|nr:hypothetical protein [Caldisericia bacterium]